MQFIANCFFLQFDHANRAAHGDGPATCWISIKSKGGPNAFDGVKHSDETNATKPLTDPDFWEKNGWEDADIKHTPLQPNMIGGDVPAKSIYITLPECVLWWNANMTNC